MNILLIVLGCNIYSILLDRLETTFDFINKNDQIKNNSTQITWFLSGGIKNTNDIKAKTEASIIKTQIDNIINLNYGTNNFFPNWNFILDEKSTNTAENFIRASEFLNKTTMTFDEIYVITSKFHYKRAKTMLKLIDPLKKFNWILSTLEETDSKYWENVHFNNIHNDIVKARNKVYSRT